MSGFKKEQKTNLTPEQLELFDEYETMCRELIGHIASLWWAFDPKDERARMIRKIADAYSKRLCAANCGMPEPESTECIEDELRGMIEIE